MLGIDAVRTRPSRCGSRVPLSARCHPVDVQANPAIGLFVAGVLLLVMAASTVAMLNGSRVAWRLACGVASVSALGCAALPLLASNDTPPATPDADTIVVVLDRYPATTPAWVRWSEAAGVPVFISGAALAAVVLLLPSTRRDLRVRQGATG